MNGRVAKRLRKQAITNVNNPARETNANLDARQEYKQLKKEYTHGK